MLIKLDGQSLLLVSNIWNCVHTKLGNEMIGFPDNSTLASVEKKMVDVARLHKERIRISLARYPRFKNRLVLLPLFVLADSYARVALEQRRCASCDARLTIADTRPSYLYVMVPFREVALCRAGRLPRANCPACGEPLPRGIVWGAKLS